MRLVMDRWDLAANALVFFRRLESIQTVTRVRPITFSRYSIVPYRVNRG